MTTTPEAALTEYRSWAVEEFRFTDEPYYVPVADEVELFRAAWDSKIPVLLKGPTGCGKTRFVEYMAFQLSRPVAVTKAGKKEITQESSLPLVTRPVEGGLEILGQEGKSQCVTSNSADDFRDRVKQLVDDPAQREQLGQQNRARIGRHFTITAMVDRYAELYSQLLASS